MFAEAQEMGGSRRENEGGIGDRGFAENEKKSKKASKKSGEGAKERIRLDKLKSLTRKTARSTPRGWKTFLGRKGNLFKSEKSVRDRET